jgi:hypothetical protein
MAERNRRGSLLSTKKYLQAKNPAAPTGYRREGTVVVDWIIWSSKCTLPAVMVSNLQLDGLLFSVDTQVLCVMNQILEKFAINTQVCGELTVAIDTVTHRRLDTVIVDWNGTYDPTRVVRATRRSSPNSNSTIVAIVSKGSETHALLAGTNFMIHRPANPDHAKRCMRAAYGTMLQQRRRTARVPVDIMVVARVTELGALDARISDLSIGGLALQCAQPLQNDWEVSVLFPLPGANNIIRVTGRVVNANATGRAGIRFSSIPPEELCTLEDWLATELAKLENVELPAQNGLTEMASKK